MFRLPTRTVPLAALCFTLTSGAALAAVKQYTIEDFLGTTDYTGMSWSHSGEHILVSSDATGTYNAYAIPVSGGKPKQLTDSDSKSIFALSYFPGDDRFIYTADEGGNELNHVYVQTPDGETTDLTPGENLKAQFRGWNADLSGFFIGSNERDQQAFDIYLYNTDDFERELFYQNDEAYAPGPISDDMRYLALEQSLTNADTDIYLHDRKTGTTRLISPEKEAVQNEAAFFSPDGKSLYYLTDGGSEFEYLARYEIATGSTEKVLQADWDVAYAGLSRSNKYILVGINRDARTELRMYEFGSMRRHDLPEVNGDITSARLSNDDKQLAMYVTGSAIPSDLFVSDLKQSRPRQLTSSLNPAIDPDDLVEAEVKWFESFNSLEVPGIYYQPRDVSARNTAPALVWVHGGPGGQSRVGYSALIQYLVNHGYVVYAINNRGSSGYGKTFFHLDDRKHGEDDLQDCVEAKNWLGNMPQVDAGRIGIIGGSYGGFMVLAALTFRPEAFDVGVDIFGISNWHRTVNSIPPWWESYRMALESEMGDFDDEEFFKAKSPIFHYENIEKPLMVLQGANDPRVLQVESDEIVEAVRANGIPVEYVLFPDEGHGFRQKQNRITGYKAILQFLDTYLSGDRPTTGQ